MAVCLFILGTEARHYHIRSEIPDDPHDVSKNLIVVPDAHALFGRLRKPEIDCSCEELFGVVDASRIEQFLCSNNTEDRKSTRLNSSHLVISYAVFCLKKKNDT